MTGLKQHIGPILIVEDDPEDRLLTEDALEEISPSFPVKFLENGEELMAYLQQREEGASGLFPTPGVIVLDLNMPKLDGREALEMIKSHPELKSIPVIILTTSSDSKDINACYELGANSYITKPSNYRELVAIMETIKNYWFEMNQLPDKPTT